MGWFCFSTIWTRIPGCMSLRLGKSGMLSELPFHHCNPPGSHEQLRTGLLGFEFTKRVNFPQMMLWGSDVGYIAIME